MDLQRPACRTSVSQSTIHSPQMRSVSWSRGLTTLILDTVYLKVLSYLPEAPGIFRLPSHDHHSPSSNCYRRHWLPDNRASICKKNGCKRKEWNEMCVSLNEMTLHWKPWHPWLWKRQRGDLAWKSTVLPPLSGWCLRTCLRKAWTSRATFRQQ